MKNFPESDRKELDIIAQMPEVIWDVIENEKTYVNILKKGIESCDFSTASYYQTEDEIVKSLQKEIEKDDITFEQKKYYFEKMVEAAERKENKDTEHRNQILTVLKYGGEAFAIGLLITVGFLIGREGINVPNFKKA